MAVRVTVDQVKDVVATTISDLSLENIMIAMANQFVDENLADVGLSANALKWIELYLAAHFVALTEEKGGIILNEVGEARERYSDIYDTGFRATRYGQQAIALDTTGTLAKYGSARLKADFRVV